MFDEIPRRFMPSVVVAIDDNQWFLDILAIFLGDDRLVIPFIGTKEASSYLGQYKRMHCSGEKNHSEIENRWVLPDFSTGVRFHQHISTIICDYDMPIENGLDFFTRLSALALPCQRILLTGMMEKAKGVGALKQGSIEYFVLKDELMEASEALENLLSHCRLDFYRSLGRLSAELSILKEPPYS